MNIKKLIVGAMASAVMFGFMIVPAFAANTTGNGFDANGYNNTARIFNGTFSDWCLAGGQTATCMGGYSNDKLIMKWNAQWDNCNATDSLETCLGAWTDNEVNGQVPNGSGEVWHYKIIWVGPLGGASPYWLPGGVSVWGNYEIVMGQGTDYTGHWWYVLATPNGYGAVFGN